MALIQEHWEQDIKDNLWADNAYLKFSVDHSEFVDGYGIVHIPNSGPAAGVQVNRGSVPATILTRTDLDANYSLFEYTTDPILVKNLDETQISYNKRMSVMGQQISQLGDVIGNKTSYLWAANIDSTRIIRSTGSASTASLATSAATGTRKQVILADLRALRAKMDKDNVPQSGRKLLIPSDIYNNDFLAIPEVIAAQNFGKEVLPEGVIARVLGFDLIIRSSALVYSGGTGATQVLQVLNGAGQVATASAGDNYAVLAWHPTMVATAKGSVFVMARDKSVNPEYYGTIMSALVMHGGRAVRTDNVGVYALVQG